MVKVTMYQQYSKYIIFAMLYHPIKKNVCFLYLQSIYSDILCWK